MPRHKKKGLFSGALTMKGYADHAALGNKIKTQTNRWRQRIGSLPR